MRTIKELLELLLNHLIEEKVILRGLCLEINILYDIEVITMDEHVRLSDYICNYNNHKNIYLFPVGELELRINWLKERIEELKEE